MGSNKEWETTGAPFTYLSSAARSGNFGMSIYNGVRSGVVIGYQTGNADTPTFSRFYLNLQSLPTNGPSGFWAIANNTTLSSTLSAILEVETNGSLTAYTSAGVAIATVTAPSTNTWHRIEVYHDISKGVGNQIFQMRLDGQLVMSSTTARNLIATSAERFGGNMFGGSADTGNQYIDDIAINDSSGTTQNSWPGDGETVMLHATGNGDTIVSMSTSTGNFWDRVSEVAPDDGLTVATMTATSGLLDVTVTQHGAAGIGASDTINLVQVGARIAGVTSGGLDWAPGMKVSVNGNVSSGTLTAIASTVWNTNDDTAEGKFYKLTVSTSPDTGSPLTVTDIDNTQLRLFTDNVGPGLGITTLWAMVDYSSVTVVASPVMPSMGLLGIGGNL
jgi:hypothetical protein